LVTGLPLVLLRIEGAALLAGSVYLYAKFERSWILFAICFLTPDLSLLAVIASKRVGALAYNAVHVVVGPVVLAVIGVAADRPLLWALALIWLAHIGMDRAVGYGLRYPAVFEQTHLGIKGKVAGD
jgi:hypothetical protein